MFVPTGTASVTSLAWSGRTGESIGKIGCGERKEVKMKEERKRERGGKIIYNLYVPGMGQSTFLKALEYIPSIC